MGKSTMCSDSIQREQKMRVVVIRMKNKYPRDVNCFLQSLPFHSHFCPIVRYTNSQSIVGWTASRYKSQRNQLI